MSAGPWLFSPLMAENLHFPSTEHHVGKAHPDKSCQGVWHSFLFKNFKIEINDILKLNK
jgi:hypothetical protein